MVMVARLNGNNRFKFIIFQNLNLDGSFPIGWLFEKKELIRRREKIYNCDVQINIFFTRIICAHTYQAAI
ncbi:MAG: hypothetical protein A2V65_01930 [Deltaproteobacteria bacterium RBG_13_49_15]|nr:MAG: hypothetical protein A2V65_01930 [Deltaproteobacteria bacterium RBG_13_49_15]